MREHEVTGEEGVPLHVRETGPEDAPAILLIHGWSQHGLCWSKQMAGALARSFRLIAPDLRGHGASGKPDAPEAYNRSEPWAGDIAAIIAALGLDRPLLVGWSMGGWVACDYLRLHGESGIAGLVLVGTTVRAGKCADPALAAKRKPDARAEGMYSADQARALAAAIDFVKACTAAPLSKRDIAFMTGYNMLVPPHVRAACRLRDEDYRPDLAKLTRPALMIAGEADRVCVPGMARESAAALPGGRLVSYPGIGHSPFWEAPDQFDADLAGFAAEVHGVAA